MTRDGAPATFTPYRILMLVLIGPIVFMAFAVGIYLEPGGEQLFHSTVKPGELPVVHVDLVPGVTIR